MNINFFRKFFSRVSNNPESKGQTSTKRASQVTTRNEDFTIPRATKQELSILFSDIANFSALSEVMETDDLATMMNNYFETAVNQCIMKTDGTVLRYVGDAIFAIWNGQEEQLNHPELACQAALLLRDQASGYGIKGVKPGFNVRTRVGVHCGEAVYGHVGSSTRADITAIGPNVNVASKLENLNHYLGTEVVISGQMEERVRYKFVKRFIGTFIAKESTKPIAVHELISTLDKARETKAWREAFSEAEKEFRSREWEAAANGFKRVLEIKPNDGPSNFLLSQMEKLKANPPAENWQGEMPMPEKQVYFR